MRAGVVVAGGRSTRFGDADKAVACLAGVPMIRRVADRLAPAVETLVVNCRADQRSPIADALAGYDRPVEFAVDTDPDRGPVAGIRDGLRAVERERGDGGAYAAVVACDMPFVDPAFLTYLHGRATGGDGAPHDAAVPRFDGWLQVTHAVYRAGAMAEACDAALAEGDPRVVDPLDRLDCVLIEEAEVLAQTDPEAFESLDTREAFAAAERRIRARER